VSRSGDILKRIERLSSQRREAWAEGTGDAERIAGEIDEAYAELRLVRARSRSGDRTVIVRRARIEREIEKLYG